MTLPISKDHAFNLLTQGIRGHDIGDFIDSIWTNALTRTGLGGPDGDPSPSVSALRAPSLSQENSDER